MKKTLLFATLLSASAVIAQPTFTAGDIFPVGTTYPVKNVIPIFVTTGTTGENAVWDFSDMVAQSSSVFTAEVIATQGGASFFPNSSFVSKESNPSFDMFNYFKISQSSLALDGYYMAQTGLPVPPTGIQPMIFTPGVDVFRFPTSINSTFDQIIAGVQTNTMETIYRDGVQTVTCDGFGTLTTPAGTFPNSMRLKTNQVFRDSSSTQGITHVYVVETYTWISAATHGVPLVQKQTITVDGADQAIVTAFYTEPTSTGISNASQQNFSISPNPATASVLLYGNGNGEKLFVELFSVSGQKVAQLLNGATAASEVKVQLSLKGITPGIYFLKIINGNETSVKRLIIQ